MRPAMIYIPPTSPETEVKVQNEYDQVSPETGNPEDDRSLSSESDLAESPAGQTIRSSYHSPMFDQHNPLEPCPVNGCPLNPKSGVKFLLLYLNLGFRSILYAQCIIKPEVAEGLRAS